jgi:hypothetical protein
MLTPRCPNCKSKRIRHGYRPTSLWRKLLFRYNLLCDNCNWEFAGFAIPGTVSARTERRKKKRNYVIKREKDKTRIRVCNLCGARQGSETKASCLKCGNR